MIKRIIVVLLAVFAAVLLSVGAFATADGEVYDSFDDYYEFEDSDSGSAGQTKPAVVPWYSHLSIIPVVLGAVAGAATVAVLFALTPENAARKSAVREAEVFRTVLAERVIPVSETATEERNIY